MKLSCLKAVKRGMFDRSRPAAAAAYVDAAAVLDRSGSMYDLLPGARDGVRIWLEKQKGVAGGYVEVTTFDDRVEKPYSGKSDMMMESDIQSCLSALKARGWTRLYDTAVEAIHRQMKRLEAWRTRLSKSRMVSCLDVKPVAILFVLTDGEDNRSVVADAAAFKRAVALTVKKWNTVTIFAAANQDAMVAGRAYGFEEDLILQMDAAPAAVAGVFRSATASQARACSGMPPRMTQMERDVSAPSQRQRTAPPAFMGNNADDSDDDLAAYAALPLPVHTPPRNTVLRRGGGGGGGGGRGYSGVPYNARAAFMSPPPPPGFPPRPPMLQRASGVRLWRGSLPPSNAKLGKK